jgi:hypothetical protein
MNRTTNRVCYAYILNAHRERGTKKTGTKSRATVGGSLATTFRCLFV